MRRSLSAAVCVCLFAFCVSCAAQSRWISQESTADPEKFADTHVAALDQKLQLTGDQKAKLRPIFMEEIKKVQGILTSQLSSQARKEAIGRIQTEAHDKVENLLTPDQKRRFNDLYSSDESSEPEEEEPRPGTMKI